MSEGTYTRFAPYARATAATSSPIGPAPSTSTFSSARTPPRDTAACTATLSGSMSDAASSDMLSGIGCANAACRL